MSQKPIAAVVVEYTLADGSTDIPSLSIGDPVPGAAEYLRNLRAAGFEVLLVSAMCQRVAGITAVSQWAYRNQLPFDDVYVGLSFPVCDKLVFGRAESFNVQSDV